MVPSPFLWYLFVFHFWNEGIRARLENLGIYPKASIFVHINRNNVGEAISSENTSYGAFSFQFTTKLNGGDKKKAEKFISLVFYWTNAGTGKFDILTRLI